MIAPLRPITTRSTSTTACGAWPWSASTIPSSGARAQVVPRSLAQPPGPFGSGWAGNAEIPTIPIASATATDRPIPRKSVRGSVRPGSRASDARLATVSRPV